MTKQTPDPFKVKRDEMVEFQIQGRGIADPQVIKAMKEIPRHRFIPEKEWPHSYGDFPLPIGHGQTISQPYIVAAMTEAAQLKKSDKVLEIGTGSGYQAAILGQLAGTVYTLEIVGPLAESAAKTFKDLGYSNIHSRHGDGYKGWPEYAPYDVILVTAAPPTLPPKLLEQLKVGGRMVIPVGTFDQGLYLITKTEEKGDNQFLKRLLLPVRFVPMVPEK